MNAETRSIINRADFYSASRIKLRDLLGEQHAVPNEVDDRVAALTDTDNLFETGVLNSLHAMEFLEFVEDTFGVEIPIEDFELELFYTLRTIYDTFGGPNVQGTQE